MTKLERQRARMRATSVRRRARHRADGVCINGRGHGPATHGVLCEACRLVHRLRGSDSELAVQISASREYQPKQLHEVMGIVRQPDPRPQLTASLIRKVAATIVINTRRAA